MITVIPTSKYFWQDNPIMATERLSMLRRWLDQNVPGDEWYESEYTVDTIKYVFVNEQDAIAFRLKFGI